MENSILIFTKLCFATIDVLVMSSSHPEVSRENNGSPLRNIKIKFILDV